MGLEYDTVLLSTREIVDRYWGACAPILDRVVEEAMCGEMGTGDIYQAVLDGRMQCFVVKRDVTEAPEVGLVLVVEQVVYPKFAAINIVAMGGHALVEFASEFWAYFKGWCYMNGVRHIEALTSPAMTRVLTTAMFGFTPVYTKLRLGL